MLFKINHWLVALRQTWAKITGTRAECVSYVKAKWAREVHEGQQWPHGANVIFIN